MIGNDRFRTLVRLLNEGTDKGRLGWQQTADEDEYRVTLGSGMVRVGKHDSPQLLTSGEANPRAVAYYLVVLDHKNQVIEEFRPAGGEDEAVLSELFGKVRRQALNLDQSYDNLFRELEQRVK